MTTDQEHDTATTDRGHPTATRSLDRASNRAVGVFVAVTFALSWLVALPLWFGEGLASPWFYPVALAVMTSPAIAALVVVFLVERPRRKARALGLWPLTPVRRLLGYSALGIVGSIALVLVALPIGALLGVLSSTLGTRFPRSWRLSAVGGPGRAA